MASMPPVRIAAIAAALACLVVAAPAAATQVSYIDGGEIWVSTLDGSQKRNLSGPADAPRKWTEQTQSDGGAVLGVQREPGKMGNLNATRLWGADGGVLGNGSLTAKPGRTSYAYPTSLDLTPDGKTVVYGYSNWSGFGLNTTYEFGTYAEGSTNWYVEPFDLGGGAVSGTLVGNRVVAASGTTVVYQSPSGQPPYNDEFAGWYNAGGYIWRTDMAANATIAATEVGDDGSRQVAMIPFPSLGAALPSDGSDCLLPAQGDPKQVSISQDGTTMAWQDDRGVVVAGTPVWFPSAAVSTCNLSRAPVVISATGSMPSLGPSTVATPPVTPPTTTTTTTTTTPTTPTTPTPTTPKTAAPKVSLAKTVKASSLAKGVTAKVTVAAAGTVKVAVKLGTKTVATGSAKAKKAGTVSVKLKATKAYAKKLRSLRKRTVTIAVTANGRTTTVKKKLG
jgi:hypothetical protein